MKKLYALSLMILALLAVTLSGSALELFVDSSVQTDYSGMFSVTVSLDRVTELQSIDLHYDENSSAGLVLLQVEAPTGLNATIFTDGVWLTATSGVYRSNYLCTLRFAVTQGFRGSSISTSFYVASATSASGRDTVISPSNLCWIYINGLYGGGSGSGGGSGQSYGAVYGYTIMKIATRTGPGTQYDGGGTYSVQNQWLRVLAKAWDNRNGIWWVKVEIPYRNENRVLWTGYKRFDHTTLSLDDLPTEYW